MKIAKRILLAGITAACSSAVFLSMGAPQQFVTKQPTAADWAALAKLPDFNGVWERGGGGGAPRGNAAPAAAPGGPAPRGTGAPAGAPRGGAPRGGAPPAAAAPRGAAPGAPRGGGRGGMQLTPAAQAKQAAYAARNAQDSATANCVPPGMPGIMTQPYPMEFLLTPGKVTIVIEAYTQVRHIYTDGRPLPEDPNPHFFGTSIGHWEGETLVVESIGFSPATNLVAGVPPSDKMRVVERFSLSGPNTMTIETTITDPEVLAAPSTTTSTLQRHREWTITEYICQENNRNGVDAEGKSFIVTTPPGGNSSK